MHLKQLIIPFVWNELDLFSNRGAKSFSVNIFDSDLSQESSLVTILPPCCRWNNSLQSWSNIFSSSSSALNTFGPIRLYLVSESFWFLLFPPETKTKVTKRFHISASLIRFSSPMAFQANDGGEAEQESFTSTVEAILSPRCDFVFLHRPHYKSKHLCSVRLCLLRSARP